MQLHPVIINVRESFYFLLWTSSANDKPPTVNINFLKGLEP